MWERAGIVAVGDEVLTGETINTNGAWLAQALLQAGSRVAWQLVVPDDEGAIAEAVRRGLQSVPLLVLVGGLGPTPDDRTRAGVAAGLGVTMAVDPDWAAALEQRHGGQGPSRTRSIDAQAMRLAGADLLVNQVGTAPGQLVVVPAGAVALLPGPPAECRSVAVALTARVERATGRRIVRRTWRVYDLTESELSFRLGTLLTAAEGPRTGLYVRPGVVEWRVEVAEGSPEAARLPELVAEAERRAGVPLYGEEPSADAVALVRSLADRGDTVAIAESLTGGMLAAELTAVPGASRVVLEGQVVYTEAAKVRMGVPRSLLLTEGAVSRRVALALADAVRDRSGATWGLGTTGYAGPQGGDPDHPVGTYYVALTGPGVSTVYRRRSRSDREWVRRAAAETGRHLLALALAGQRAPGAEEIESRH